MQKNMDKGWVKKYRIWLVVLLVLVIVGTGWYCIAAIQKNKVPEDATLVQREAWEDEGEA